MQEGYIDSVSVMERTADLGCEEGFGSGLILTGSNLSGQTSQKFKNLFWIWIQRNLKTADPDIGKKSGFGSRHFCLEILHLFYDDFYKKLFLFHFLTVLSQNL